MISIESKSNLPDWMSLLGKTLDGGYELKEVVEAEQERVLFRVRVLGDYTLKALARFYVADQSTAESQAGVWESIRFFRRKTNLSVPLGAGTLNIDGSTVAYLVFQNPDETLAEVIASRALLPDEASEVLRSVAAGLESLHANGFVHGNVSTREVLAVADSIQLSTECIRHANASPLLDRKSARYLAPESGTENTTFASDVWCLGATLFEALTQKKYEAGLFEEAAALKHPMGALVSSCLDPDPEKRCKLADLDRISKSKPPPPKPKPVPVEPVKELSTAAAAGTSAAAGSSAAAAPVDVPEKVFVFPQPKRLAEESSTVETPMSPQRPQAPAAEPVLRPARVPLVPRRDVTNRVPLTGALTRKKESNLRDEPPSSSSSRKGWVYALAAFCVIFLFLWFIRARPRQNAVAAARSTTGTTAASPSVPKPKGQTAWPTKTLSPDSKTSAPAVTSKVSDRPANMANLTNKRPLSEGQARPVWRVILYTYVRQEDAGKRAQAISEKRPDLGTEVFSSSGTGGPFLVVAGGQMTKEEAARLRQRAVREGMPHDSYIQNFSR